MIYTKRCERRAALLAAVLTALLGGDIGYGQEDLGGAKTLYVNASYEEALSTLDKQAVTVEQSGARAAELHHYRALCLIALGRTAEAAQAIALSVAADPFTIPDTSELAPRVASVFSAARGRLVPEVARAALADGRQLMQKGDPAGANRRFDSVVRLLAEPGLAGRADLADLTLAANALAELTRAQMATAAAAAASAPSAAVSPATRPAATATTPASPAAGAPASRAGAAPARSGAAQPPPVLAPPGQRVALRPPGAAKTAAATVQAPPADDSFVPSEPISQTLPAWQPGNGPIRQIGFTGAVRVTIDSTGKVTGAVMDRSVYPPYDRLLLTAARSWTYRPATRNGQPVISNRLVEIALRPPTN